MRACSMQPMSQTTARLLAALAAAAFCALGLAVARRRASDDDDDDDDDAYGCDQGSLMAAIRDRLWLRSRIAYGRTQMDGRGWTDADGRSRKGSIDREVQPITLFEEAGGKLIPFNRQRQSTRFHHIDFHEPFAPLRLIADFL